MKLSELGRMLEKAAGVEGRELSPGERQAQLEKYRFRFVNIYQELHDDLGCYIPNNGYLVKWAKQGVMMLNTVLTVRAHAANSHRGMGWENFTDRVIDLLNERQEPMVFLLWGANARSKQKRITNPNHLVLTAPHPSPLSAYQGFFGCRHFSQCNAFLQEHGQQPIQWQLEE